uniref:Chromosome X open reading frame 65 n=1 Tax=Dromaius novaehollandiae TaxID=8790 RepID=A0A8C4KK33_DRONO
MFICVRHGDNQHFLANTDCPVLLLLLYVRRKAGAPAGAVIDLCDALGTPKLLFQAKAQSERASKFFPVPGACYYVCRVELGAPGGAAAGACVPGLPPGPSPPAEALRQHCEHQHRSRPRAPRTLEGRRMPSAETVPTTVQASAAVRGRLQAMGPPRTPHGPRVTHGDKQEPGRKERHR